MHALRQLDAAGVVMLADGAPDRGAAPRPIVLAKRLLRTCAEGLKRLYFPGHRRRISSQFTYGVTLARVERVAVLDAPVVRLCGLGPVAALGDRPLRNARRIQAHARR